MEAEAEIAATVVAVGVKVAVVGEEEVEARRRRELERGNLLCFHETIINNMTIPRFLLLATMVSELLCSGR